MKERKKKVRGEGEEIDEREIDESKRVRERERVAD